MRWSVIARASCVAIHDEEDRWIATATSPAIAQIIVTDHNFKEEIKTTKKPPFERKFYPKISWRRN
jgi:hypothetical protein